MIVIGEEENRDIIPFIFEKQELFGGFKQLKKQYHVVTGDIIWSIRRGWKMPM